MNAPVVAVAVSGGRDSTALLHATCRAARGTGLRVVALHVHHGLLPEADGWRRRLQQQCDRWRRSGAPLTLRWQRLAGSPPAGDSVEAWARRGRYAALAEMARAESATLVLLAHHAQDQAETVLLQALRSGSPRGLAAMPPDTWRDGLRWARPWLALDPAAIAAYAQRHRIGFVTDPSNADPRHARSRLRTQVWPALVRAFPGAPQALAALARRAHESAECLSALAALDLRPCVDEAGRLDRAAWLRLDEARRANALRHWLRSRADLGAEAALVERLMREWPAARGGARWPSGEVGLVFEQGRLAWGPAVAATRGATVDLAALAPDTALAADLSREGLHALGPWCGCLRVRAVARDGVPAALLRGAELRPRGGAERFQQHAGGVPRSLKKAWQTAGVPATRRAGPLVHAGDRLVFVPGLGLDARVRQVEGENLRTLEWVPDRP